MSPLSRRGLLRVAGSSLLGVGSGCISLPAFNQDSGPSRGALVVKNNDTLPHLVSLAVTDVTPPENKELGVEASKIYDSGRNSRIHIEPDEEKMYSEFLSGDAYYTVKLWLDASKAAIDPDSDTDSIIEAVLSPNAAEEPDVRGSYLEIEIAYEKIGASINSLN